MERQILFISYSKILGNQENDTEIITLQGKVHVYVRYI